MYAIKIHHKHPRGKIFAWMVLILYLGVSFVYPVLPEFVKQIVKTEESVSIFYSGMALIMLGGALISTVIFKKIPRAKILKWGFLISAIVYFLIIFVSRISELAVIRGLQVCAHLFVMMAISLYVRDFATKENLGEKEGRFYKFANIGVFLGPLLGGFFAAKFGDEMAFIIASLILFYGFIYFYSKHILEEHPAIIDIPKEKIGTFFKNIKDNFSNSGRVKAYFMTMFLTMWFGFRNLYVPLYVISQGYLDSVSGLIISFGIIPYILLEMKVGQYAEKKGVRIPVSSGFLFIGLILLLIFINPYPVLNFLLLILGNIGAACIEPLQEYSLFKNLPKEDEDRLYGVHMTANPLGFFMAPSIGILVLAFLPFNYIFLAFGIIMIMVAGGFWLKLRHL